MGDLLHRLRSLPGCAAVRRLDDSGPVRRVQVQRNEAEARDGVPLALAYDLASHPQPGAVAVVLIADIAAMEDETTVIEAANGKAVSDAAEYCIGKIEVKGRWCEQARRRIRHRP